MIIAEVVSVLALSLAIVALGFGWIALVGINGLYKRLENRREDANRRGLFSRPYDKDWLRS